MAEPAESTSMAEADAASHRNAAEEFARSVSERFDEAVDSVLLFGSVARGEEHGVDSDVDLLVVLRDDVDAARAEQQIRDLAYDIELDRGVILSLIVLPRTRYEQREDRPFYQRVRNDAEFLYG